MDLNTLLKSDFKDIDLDALKPQLLKLVRQPQFLVSAAACLITIIIIFYTYGQRKIEVFSLRSEIQEIEKKITAIKAYNTVYEKMHAFREDFPAYVPTEELFELITQYAKKYQLKTMSYAPGKAEEGSLQRSNSIRLVLKTESFHDLFSFIYSIESSPLALKIDNIELLPGLEKRPVAQTTDAPPGSPQVEEIQMISVNMRISSVQLIDE